MSAQGSAEWFEQRAGRITASVFSDAISMKSVVVQKENKKEGKEKITKMVPTAARDTAMRAIVAEILSGRPRHSIGSKSLAWGDEAEDFARQAYEMKTGFFVESCGFLPHYQYDYIGGSPDGLVGTDGLIEIKCPHDEQVHIGTWLAGMPDDHMPQVQGNLMVTGREWCDFISYDPRQAEPYRLYVQRIERDEEYIGQTLLPGLMQFWCEVQGMVKVIQEKAA